MSAESSFEDEIDGPEKKSKAGCIIAALVGGGVLMIVVAIGATLILPMLVGRLSVAFKGMAKADILAIAAAVTRYEDQNGGNPPLSIEELTIPDSNGARYLEMGFPVLDPWGNEYIIEHATDTTPLRIWTYGKDGVRGGNGENQDFSDEMMRNGEF